MNAGHPLPLLLRRNGQIDYLEVGGAPIGMFPEWRYEEGSVQLESGDTLLAYTDGVTEAFNPDGAELGIEGLVDAAVRNADRSAKDLVNTLLHSVISLSQNDLIDDCSLLVIRPGA